MQIVVESKVWEDFRGFFGPVEYYTTPEGRLVYRFAGDRQKPPGPAGALKQEKDPNNPEQWAFHFLSVPWAPQEQEIIACKQNWHAGMALKCLAHVYTEENFRSFDSVEWCMRLLRFVKATPWIACSNPLTSTDLFKLAKSLGFILTLQDSEDEEAVEGPEQANSSDEHEVPTVGVASPQDPSVPPTLDDCAQLVAGHRAVSSWFDIGLALGVDQSSLEAIREKHEAVELDDTACSEMLSLWLSSAKDADGDEGLPRTMDMVLQALEEVMKEENVNGEDIRGEEDGR